MASRKKTKMTAPEGPTENFFCCTATASAEIRLLKRPIKGNWQSRTSDVYKDGQKPDEGRDGDQHEHDAGIAALGKAKAKRFSYILLSPFAWPTRAARAPR